MRKNSRVFPATCSDSDFLARLEQIVADYSIVDFCFENMIETLLTQFLQSFGALDRELDSSKATYFEDGPSSVAQLTYNLEPALLRR